MPRVQKTRGIAVSELEIRFVPNVSLDGFEVLAARQRQRLDELLGWQVPPLSAQQEVFEFIVEARIFAGSPPWTVQAGTSFTTTELAATNVPSPIEMFGAVTRCGTHWGRSRRKRECLAG